MEPFLGEIRNFSFGLVPKGWAACNGQTLQIAQNQALFALLGTNFGGNGTTTFQLPNLNGRYAVGGNGGAVGGSGGEATHALLLAEMPMHVHPVQASSSNAVLGTQAANAYPATATAAIYSSSADTSLGPGSSAAGSGQGHQNMSPYLPINYCIAIQGIYPARS